MPRAASCFAFFSLLFLFFSPAIGITYSVIETRLAMRSAMRKFDNKKGNVATEKMHIAIEQKYKLFLRIHNNSAIAKFKDQDFNI